MAPAPRHDGRWAFGVAEHHRQVLKIGALRNAAEAWKPDRPAHLGIHHQPGFVEVQVDEFDAEQLARRTARAVAADDVPRRHLPMRAVVQQRRGDMTFVLFDFHQRRTKARLDIRIAREAFAQNAFQFGLIEKIVVGPAEFVVQAGGT
jgi:hypothetical protein